MSAWQSILAEEEVILSAITSLLGSIPSALVNTAVYAFTALSLYTIATRRGIPHAWLSWIPIANIWVIGSLSDQYRYVVKGQYKSKRKVLVILKLLCVLVSVITAGMVLAALVRLLSAPTDSRGCLQIALSLSVPILVGALLAINTAVIRWMALYDLYSSCDPSNRTVFLVVSILLPITEPIFLFLIRERDGGMPPRRVTAEPEFG